MGSRALPVRDDLTPEALYRLARREPDRMASGRMFAIANALKGMNRSEAARLAGMERLALRDPAEYCNTEGLPGLRNRPRLPRPGKLDETGLHGVRANWARSIVRPPTSLAGRP